MSRADGRRIVRDRPDPPFPAVFSARGALVHAGALIGTLMAFNVSAVIIPNRKKAVAALLAGEAPDPRLGAVARQRSVHNTCLTLPALLPLHRPGVQ